MTASDSEKHSATSDQILSAAAGVHVILQISTTRDNIKISSKLEGI